MRYLLILLIGTAQAQEIGSQQYWDLLHYRCTQYGFEPDTPAFAGCKMQLDQAAKDRAQQRQRDLENMILQQGLQDDAQRRYRQMPLCSQLAPGMQGYMRAQGACR